MKNKISVAELQRTSEFARLTVAQKMFVTTYCTVFESTGQLDSVFAARAAYQSHDAEGFRTLAYQILAKPRIIFALNEFFGEQSLLREEVERAMISGKFDSRRLTNIRKILEGKKRGKP